MARAKVLDAIDAGDATCVLDSHHVLLELPLTSTCQHNCLTRSLRNAAIFPELLHLMLFPNDEAYRGPAEGLTSNTMSSNEVVCLGASEVYERPGQFIWEPREVHALQAAPVGE